MYLFMNACISVIYIYIYIVIHPQSVSLYYNSSGHCWRSRDELIGDVLLWTPTPGRAKAGRPARTYIQQLCEDTGCCPEDLPEAMNDREKWRERVRDIRATSTTWWWWWWQLISVAKLTRCFKLPSKPRWLYASWISYCTATCKLRASKGILIHMYYFSFVYIYVLYIYIYIYVYIYYDQKGIYFTQ